ncbi:hypothetical protein Vadar_032190 [Vaccinium darrowii]|uniref:Uncharacterized protein n=1 Tax=Vaccinium darrowii TaxID=229202 RepID=A0ACB7X636_9ERIC|nr:hypothetical protein Vadar_032190 [Vaccinium darrowii]
MAFYADEEEVWKCPKHPSKRRRTGICPTCLKDRLGTLCPDCATVRPCECCPTATASSSSSSSSSSFSIFSAFGSRRESSIGSVGRVSNLIESEPAFRRSRSVAIPFFRSRFAGDGDSGGGISEKRRKSVSFWSVFRTHKGKKGEEEREEGELNRNSEAEAEVEAEENYLRRMMRRSRSVASGMGEIRSSSRKGRGWHFPSPMGVFRHSKTSKVIHERSPLYRG